MNTAIEFKTEETLTQDNHVTADIVELPFVAPVEKAEHKLEWVTIHLTNPESLD